MSGARAGWPWLVWLGVGAAAIVVYFLLPNDQWYRNSFYDLIGLTSAVIMLVAVRKHRPTRARLWYLFGAGQVLWVLGDLTYSFHVYVLGIEPFPSAADGLYLAAYPLLVGGLFILIRGRTSGRDRAGLIDACIIATGLGLLAWTFLMRPIAVDTSLDVVSRLVSLAYPTADVLMLAMLARLFTGPGARTASYRLLVSALVLLLGSDIVYSLLTSFSRSSVHG